MRSPALGAKLLAGTLSLLLLHAPAQAQTANELVDARTPPDGEVNHVPTAVFDALETIERTAGGHYGRPALFALIRAVWADATYGIADEDLARELRTSRRPLAITATDGRTLDFTKLVAPDSFRLQSAFLPGQFNPQDSSYYADVFRATKDAGVLVGACHVNPQGAELMNRILTELINLARFTAKQNHDDSLTRLFATLRAAHDAAAPRSHGNSPPPSARPS
jgi:hypothetical protein